MGRSRTRPGHRHHAVPVGPQHPGRRVPVSYNCAQFLGHLPGSRGARGPVQLRAGDLVLMDEASMVAIPDLADVITQAAAVGAKVILAGDTQQLQAVENGGGMSVLADALGYAQLTDPVRFQAAWEQAASLRLRDGDATVLAEYDQHGRIIGGEPEQMMDAAAAAYVALTLDGTDTLLMAADHALRRELNRRIREDLITLGIVSDGPAVTIADATQASSGDLIICTRNDHSVEAGEPGRAWPTATCSASRPSPGAACLSAGLWMITREPGSAGGPTDTSCSIPTRMPNWDMRSPTTPPRAAP